MSARKPAALTASLLVRKGLASAAGFAQAVPNSLDTETRPGGSAGAPTPAVAPATGSSAPGERRPHPFARPRKALIVEDNTLDLKLFRDLLEAQGFATLQARSGADGLRLAREQRPDLILVDADLPGGSGVECIARIRRDERLGSIPLIVVTAFVCEEESERLAGGCHARLAKPISVSDFLRTCARVCPAPSA